MKLLLPAALCALAPLATAQVTVLGPGCPGASTNAIGLEMIGEDIYDAQPVDVVVGGKNYHARVTGLPNSAEGFLSVGLEPIVGGLPLPGIFGPTCSLQIQPLLEFGYDSFVFLIEDTASFPFDGIPGGAVLYLQAFALDPGPLTLGSLSNGLRVEWLPEDAIVPGQVRIEEIHHSPLFGDPLGGEWIELETELNLPIDIEGCTLRDDSGQSHLIDNGGNGVVVSDFGPTLLGGSLDPALNGGVDVDYAWSGFSLDGFGDQIELVGRYGQVITRIDYAAPGWPTPTPGISLQLSQDLSTLTGLFEGPEGWCDARDPIGGALGNTDLASPDKLNEPCPCTGATDLPDLDFFDLDCDGIDGSFADGVFVAVDGSDLNPGTAAAPLASIQKAVSIVQGSPDKTSIYVSEGEYVGTVAVTGVARIYGGYSRANGWARSTEYTTVLHGTGGPDNDRTGLVIEDGGLLLQLIEVSTPDAPVGRDAVAIAARAADVTLEGVTLRPGRGGDGVAGNNGAAGFPGTSGLPGSIGFCDWPEFIVPGGNGAPGGSSGSSPGGPGGRGGDGGNQGSYFEGAPGLFGLWPHGAFSGNLVGGQGGKGGLGGPIGQLGDPGQWGQTGPAGADGAAPSASWDVLVDSIGRPYFVSLGSGSSGLAGAGGAGGGGGGGGGGQTAFIVVDGAGSSGGGGGGGGGGGLPGHGGSAGGSSVGLILVGGSANLDQCLVAAGGGGNGGSGGGGGTGGSGGAGGPGGVVCPNEIGSGGNGGRGGDGGRGGHGSGGAGGASLGIVRSDTDAVFVESTDFQLGPAGAGGASAGAPGPAGMQAEVVLL